MIPRATFRLLAALALFALLTFTAVSAGRAGTYVSGSIVDAAGAPLPGVTVTLKGGDKPRVQVTDASGRYVFRDVPPGTYELRGELESFSVLTKPGIKVTSGRTIEVDLTLVAAVGREDLIVTSEASLLDQRRDPSGARTRKQPAEDGGLGQPGSGSVLGSSATGRPTIDDVPAPGGNPTSIMAQWDLDAHFYSLGIGGLASLPASDGMPDDTRQVFITDFLNQQFSSERRDAQRSGDRRPPVLVRVSRTLKDVFASWFRLPEAIAAAHLAPGRRSPAASPAGASLRIGSAARQVRRAPSVSIVATARSSGAAFEVQVLAPSGEPMRVLAPDGLILQAVRDGAAPSATEPAARAANTASLAGFCLEFEKPRPAAGTQYRVAPDDLQTRYRPMRHVLQAGRELADAGRFNPDSDPEAYAVSIRQWALWTRQEGWTAEDFTRALVDRTTKNAAQSGGPWTAEMEAALIAAAPNRFRDVQAVLREADALGRRSEPAGAARAQRPVPDS